jgi:hypothetical protein
MGLERLFDKLVIDWEEFRGPRAVADSHARGPSRPPLPARTIETLRADELGDADVLRGAYRTAVARGLLADSEANFLAFLSTAAYCERVGVRPAALFLHLVRAGRFPATLEDEDRAVAALKRALSAERGACRWLKPADRPPAPGRGEDGAVS